MDDKGRSGGVGANKKLVAEDALGHSAYPAVAPCLGVFATHSEAVVHAAKV